MGCGICGFAGLNDSKLLNQMCDVLTHRGPDDSGTFLDTNIGLGVRRLKIIDLAGGKQPLSNEDGSIWIVFNGEIYNYVELRPELERQGHRFRTESDTEVIVHAYEQWGERCLDRFIGMFAFAIWDGGKKRLMLARDRFGKKPLYYSAVGKRFLFASEMKGILQDPEVSRDLDYVALDHFLTYAYIPSPLTIFSHIRKIPPGSYLLWNDGGYSIHPYWDMDFSMARSTISEEDLVKRLFDLLNDSVKIRLRSDVPLGAFLSGGIDSSTIVALMVRHLPHSVKTYCVGFEDENYSELGWAKKVSELIGTDHHELVMTPDSIKLLPRLVWHFDEPFADPSMIPTYLVSEAARKDVTVALSGDGGDEMFAGYPFLLDPPQYRYYRLFPKQLNGLMTKTLSRVPIKKARMLATLVSARNYSNQSPELRYFLRTSHFGESEIRELYSQAFKVRLGSFERESYLLSYFDHADTQDYLDAADYTTIKTYLSEDVLVKVDRMSMAVSLEVRSPFLDHRVAELMEGIPSSMKVKGDEFKHILKRMVVQQGLLPREIAYRKKQGFGIPLGMWLKREWKEPTSQLLENGLADKDFGSILSRDAIRKILRDPMVNSTKIFSLVMLVLWYKMYMRPARASGFFNIDSYT